MKLLTALLAASALAAVPGAASAADLLNVVNPAYGATSYSLAFTAGASNTTVTFGGYDKPSWSDVTNIFVHLAGDSTNLLGSSFNLTPASCGSLAYQNGGGTYGTNNLEFGGTCSGQYDLFSQSFASTIGSSYVIDFSFLSSGRGDNGLLVQASDAMTAAVPEPATWLTMILGFGAMGFAMRRRNSGKLATA